MKRIIILLLLLTACSITGCVVKEDFTEAVKRINEIDNNYGISLSDYENGMEYLRAEPRYPNPINPDDIDFIVEKYSEIWGSEPVNLYVSFRKNLLLAEKHYKLAYKSYKGVIEKYGIRCSYKEQILESFENQRNSAQFGQQAISDLKQLRENYPEEFNYLNITDEWITTNKNFFTDLEGDVGRQERKYEYFCLNMTE